MSSSPSAHPGAGLYRLVVEAEPSSNVLLRLLEPFVIHDVLPHRIDVMTTPEALGVELEFTAEPDLAERLRGRLEAMVPVRDVACAAIARPSSVAA